MNTVRITVAFVLVIAAAHAARGGSTVDPVIETIEALKQAQGADAAFIGRNFGPDGASPISFLSSIDPQGRRYSYQAEAGATYLGLPLSLSVAGAFDEEDGMWHSVAEGMLGGSAWTQTGAGMFIADAARDVSTPETLPPPWWSNFGVEIGGTLYDLHAHVTYGPDAGGYPFSTGTVRFTIDGEDVATATAFDHLNPDCTWTWNLDSVQVQGVEFRVSSDGAFMDGNGSFVMRIDVPTPACAWLLWPAALAGRRRRR